MARTPPLIILTPGQLDEAINEALIPLCKRLDAIEKKMGEARLGYSTMEVGKMINASDRAVRAWISKGKENAAGRQIYLKAIEMFPGRYRVMPADLENFLNHFKT